MSKKKSVPSEKGEEQLSEKLPTKEKPPEQKPPKSKKQSVKVPDSSESKPGDVPVDVQDPEPPKAAGFLSGILSLDDTGTEPPKRKRGRPPKAKKFKLQPDELAKLLLVPLLLAAAAHFIPEAVQPLDDEALGFCAPLARIIIRHIPEIPASADVVDLGQSTLAGIAYYMRIRPILDAIKESEGEEVEHPSDQGVKGSDNDRGHKDATIIEGEPGRSGLHSGSSRPVDAGDRQDDAAV